MNSNTLIALNDIVTQESLKLKKLMPIDHWKALINIIRRYDVISLFYLQDAPEDVEISQRLADIKYFQYGWSKAVNLIINKFNDIDYLPFLDSDELSIKHIDIILLKSGKIAFLEQLLDYVAHNLMHVRGPKKNKFFFKVNNQYSNIDAESFDRESFNYFKGKIINAIIKEKKKEYNPNLYLINQHLEKVVKNPYGNYISYETTKEIDEHYSKLGYFHLLSIQNYDDFSDDDIFGGIKYKIYLDVVQEIIGTALFHRDACVYLSSQNQAVDIHNTISYLGNIQSIQQGISSYLNLDMVNVRLIFSCLSLSKDNYQHYLSIPYCPPPMFIQVSTNQYLRSTSGCLSNPLIFLKHQLKSKFKRDYDIAVNKREKRFREDIFNLFNEDHIIKINNGVNIKFDGIATDIDEIVFDTKTSTLGLFQLKWPDPFSHSMRERRSKISNIFPKANEWIDKISTWLNINNNQTILNSLQIQRHDKSVRHIDNIYLFVLSRNNINFTGVEFDDRAAWASWYQVLESYSNVKALFDDPIKSMYVKIKFYNPTHIDNRPVVPLKINRDILSIGKYKMKLID